MSAGILPIDVIDHILSFLRSDIISLERCVKSHPILSDLSERYIYAEVTLRDETYKTSTTTYLRTREFTQILARKPDIANHVRSLKVICSHGSLTSSHLDGVASLLPMLAGLTKFTIMGENDLRGFPPHIYGFPWHDIPETFCQAFLHHLHPRDIVIHNVTFFPMELLNDHRNVRVSLSDCGNMQYAYDGKSTASLESYSVPFEHLSIRYCSNTGLEHIATWVKLQGLRTLEYVASRFSNHLQQLLVACSNSLTSLELNTSGWRIGTPYQISDGCAIYDGNAVQLPFTFAGLRHLTHLQVMLGSFIYSNKYWTPFSPIPTIADLVSTAPPTLRQMSIKFCFVFIGLDFELLPDPAVIWSPFVLLASSCSSASISLYISPHFVIRDSKKAIARGFFSPLADYKGLMPYVQSGAVVISEDYLEQ